MKSLFPLFIILLVFGSCSNSSEEERLQKIVEQWQGKHIELPKDMTDFLTGDTIDLSNADFIILNYIDSTGCTGCKMKLALWKELLCSLDTLTDAIVETLTLPSFNTFSNEKVDNRRSCGSRHHHGCIWSLTKA